MNPTIVSQNIKSKKALFFFTLIFIISGSLYGQRSFFVDNKILFNCDSTKLIFEEGDTLVLDSKVYWEVKPDSIQINGNFYYPFIFSIREPDRVIWYIRYSQKKVYILPDVEPVNSKEELLFDFVSRKSCNIESIYRLGGYSIHKVRKYYSFHFREMIYIFKMDINGYPCPDLLDEIHVGIKSGLVKAHFWTEYDFPMECVRKID